MQPHVGADGGTASIGEIITRLRNHRPIVLADRESARVAEWRERGIELHVLPQRASGFFGNPTRSIGSYMHYRRQLKHLIKSSGTKIVHANDPLALQLALPAAHAAGASI